MEQQALRWKEIHEIENLMGRGAFLTLLIREQEAFARYWTKDNPCLGFNDGYYQGYEAVKGYFDALRDLSLVRAECARAAYPEELGGKSAEELLGVGAVHAPNLSTPLIELAGDMQTAKGLWYLLAGGVDFRERGWGSLMRWGRLGVDFVKEPDGWKIKNAVFAEDIRGPMGTDWIHPAPAAEADPRFRAAAEFQMPAPNVKIQVHQLWHSRRPLKAFPPVPLPYETFSETFSYGAEEVRA